MNTTEVTKLLAVIAARYPNSKVLEQEPGLTIQAWHMTLDDVSLADAQRVLVDWFKAEKWAPDPSEIRSRLAERHEAVAHEQELARLIAHARSFSLPPSPLREIPR